jgi:hypothetical protein
MTQNDLDNGRLVCLIGVAAPRPAEFVIFGIRHCGGLAALRGTMNSRHSGSDGVRIVDQDSRRASEEGGQTRP